MMTAESQQLLAEYVANRSERAFQELVARYVDLVYSAALRLVDDDAHRAQDVAQTVFIDLARMAPQLSPNTMLGGWLHRHTCFVARTLMRGERRRQARERQAVEMSALDHHPDAALAEVAAVLDEAIHELGADDRDALLLRFFERRNLRAVGEALGINENVAQKRVARAVQELALLLRKRGFTLSAAALAVALSAGAVKAAPVGLALGLAKGALASVVASGSTAGSATKLALLSKLKVGLASLIIIAGLGTMVWLQFSSPARQPNAQALSQPPPAEPAVDEQTSARVTAADPLPSSLERTVAQAALQPSVEPPPAATLDPAPVDQSALSARAALAAAFPPGDFVRRFVSRSGSRLTIQGTSMLGKWQAQSTIMQGFLEIEPTAVTNAQQLRNLETLTARAEVLVPVTALKSITASGTPYSDAMDRVLQEQLLGTEGKQKKLRFQLTRLALEGTVETNAAMFRFQARGTLAVAGVTNPISLPVSLLPQADGKWKLSGNLTLTMSSFGINAAQLRTPNGYVTAADVVLLQFDWMVAPAGWSPTASGPELVPLRLELPKPGFKSEIVTLPQNDDVERPANSLRPPLLVPPGLTNLARGCKLTCSDKNARAQALAKIVDGNKEASEENVVLLRKGAQWVQLDLGGPCEVFAVVLWHAHDASKVYHDVVVQLADDPDCTQAVQTLFNNDQTNALGLGVGTNREYIESFAGKLINAKGTTGQYLRFYSRGSTHSALNEYTEIEVYGRRVQ